MRKGGEREKERESTGVESFVLPRRSRGRVVAGFTSTIVSMMPMAEFSTCSGVERRSGAVIWPALRYRRSVLIRAWFQFFRRSPSYLTTQPWVKYFISVSEVPDCVL